MVCEVSCAEYYMAMALQACDWAGHKYNDR